MIGRLDDWMMGFEKPSIRKSNNPAAHSGKPLCYSNSLFLQAAILSKIIFMLIVAFMI
jgi:hypothetical protein